MWRLLLLGIPGDRYLAARFRGADPAAPGTGRPDTEACVLARLAERAHHDLARLLLDGRYDAAVQRLLDADLRRHAADRERIPGQSHGAVRLAVRARRTPLSRGHRLVVCAR